MNNPNLDRLEKIIGLVDQSYVKPEEFVTFLEVFKNVIQELKQQLESQLTDVESKANTSIKEVSYTLNELELKVKGLINDSQSTSLSQIKELSQRLTSEMSRIEATIPTMSDLSVYEAELEQIRASIPEIKDFVLVPKEVRDSLEILRGDERLDASAIKGLGARNLKLSDEIVNRAIGIVDSRTSYLINKVNNLQIQVNNISSSTSGSGTWYEEVLTYTDGTNYTLAHTPTSIVLLYLNGQKLTIGTEYTRITTAITLISPALASDILVAVYS